MNQKIMNHKIMGRLVRRAFSLIRATPRCPVRA